MVGNDRLLVLRNQPGRHMQTMKWPKFALPMMFMSSVLLAGCSTTHSNISSGSNDDGEVSFPDPAHATMPEGIFVNIENLRKVAPGVTKDQLYNLLGGPHFSEGVFGVRRWNYIFDFRRQGMAIILAASIRSILTRMIAQKHFFGSRNPANPYSPPLRLPRPPFPLLCQKSQSGYPRMRSSILITRI